eukprot:Trichotokara_eunicae@DN5648_c0_g1_i3.p1
MKPSGGSSPKSKKKLSDQQVREYRHAFTLFDSDGNGTIDAADLAKLLRSMGEAPSDDEITELVHFIDADGSGEIDFEEFMTIMSTRIKDNDVEEEMRAAFSVFDSDGDGWITPQELHHALEKTLKESLTHDEVNALIGEVDRDGDGQINLEEFLKLMVGK